MHITILGCGSSLGVPALRYGWGQCNPDNPKNRRTRSSIKIDTDTTSLLIDMSPDLLWQIQKCKNQNVDAVFFTHTHYDHVNGINELRPIFLGEKRKLPIYSSSENLMQVKRMFYYLFEDTGISIYKSYLELHEVQSEFSVGDIHATCFELSHGYSTSLGIRIGNFAYTTDVNELNGENFRQLQNLDTWIVDCISFNRESLTHANLQTALKWIDIVKPRRAFFTHMDSSMDYDTLLSLLPTNIAPAYDQMEIEV